MEVGEFAQYHWLEAVSFNIHKLLQTCPDSVLGKCVVVTSFDSGPLQPSAEELAGGWLQHGVLAVLPHAVRVTDLPYDQYDEWYVFPSACVPQINETFVNDGIFTLKGPAHFVEQVSTLGSQADIVGARYLANCLEQRQDLFWEQMNRLHPESFIAHGDRFIFVTHNPELFEEVKKAVQPSGSC